MNTDKYLAYKALVVVLAAAGMGGCSTVKSGPEDLYTYCSRYGNAPECSGKVEPAPVAAAAEPAAAPAPQEPTVVVADAGPPPNKPGECYTKVLKSAEFKDEPQQQMVRAAGERVEYSEPQYQEVEERIVVKPASKRVTAVPAEYGEVEEKILVREAYRREIEIPELYNTYYEQVADKPARDVWKPGRGEIEKVDPVTGEILCLVHEEATYRTVERKELARAASKRYEDVPAEYSTVRKTVVTKPAGTQEVEIPAEYQTIRVTKLVKAPEAMSVPVAAEYATVNKQVLVKPEHEEWTQVLCDVNATPGKVQQVESALKSRGYAVNEDGQIDAQLNEAVRSFQQSSGLHANGMMTAETLAALGVELK